MISDGSRNFKSNQNVYQRETNLWIFKLNLTGAMEFIESIVKEFTNRKIKTNINEPN